MECTLRVRVEGRDGERLDEFDLCGPVERVPYTLGELRLVMRAAVRHRNPLDFPHCWVFMKLVAYRGYFDLIAAPGNWPQARASLLLPDNDGPRLITATVHALPMPMGG